VRIDANFVRSAAGASDFPRDGAPRIALVGRSNVGKSSLINALVRQRIARTSAAPGKTRLANIYRIARSGGEPLYLVDLPGYGYARGGPDTARAFGELTQEFFGQGGVEGRAAPRARPAALLLVDARHPGLESDIEAWAWLRDTVDGAAIVATKIDKLARGQRIRALRELESVFEHPVLPVSAVTGEGLDELWKLIDRLTSHGSRQTPPRSSPSRRSHPQGATAERLPRRARRPPKD
jgi:GTP-binding protein